MRRYFVSMSSGILILGLVTLGCSHSRRHCAACQSGLTGVAMLPSQPAPTMTVSRKVEKQEPKEVEPLTPTESVAVPMTVPVADGSAETVTGTIILSSAEAKALGIRPGYTPGALYIPTYAPQLPAAPLAQGTTPTTAEPPAQSETFLPESK